MVSSEVQRTLVKSPPELWAEISDPDSLARHLGEFGEIRITRVHPEQRVEWETDDACGTVAIKPSGWGTKVKLTVTRELPPAAEAATLPTAASEPAAQAESEARAEAQPAADLEAEHELTAEPESESEDAAADVAVAEDAVADSAVAEGDVAEDFAEENLLGEDDLVAGALASDDDDQTGAEAAEDREIDLPSAAAQAPGEWASELDQEPLREPRRGFFARLFGRRRSARLAPREADGPALPSEPDEAAHDQLAALDEQADTQSGEAETDEPTLAQPFPESIAQLEDELLGVLPPPDALAATPAAPAAGSDAAEDARFEELHEHLAAADDPLAEPAGAEPTTQFGPDVKAAEEIATEQVTAVLTGVLDRLGAAHHRPFSRS
jgi:hypothetical protein